jgi:hypothetical protein
MLSIVPHTIRIKVAVLAAVVAATSAGCGWMTTESAGTTAATTSSGAPTTVADADCRVHALGPSSVDGVFAKMSGFTVTEACPSEAFPAVASQQFDSLVAGVVSQNGNQILRVLAGQLKSGTGDAFVDKYLQNLSTQTREGVGLPSETQELGGDVVTHFNVPLTAEGYTFSDGPTIVIAYVEAGSPPATVEDALTHILNNVG